MIEAEGTRMMGVTGEDRNAGTAEAVEMPLPEMGRRVAGRLQGLGDGLLLQAERIAMILHARPIIGSSRQDGRAAR